MLYFLTSILQLSSTLVFLCALARIHDETAHIATFVIFVSFMFAGIIAVQQIRGFDGTITEWYVFYLPLLVTQAFIVWHVWDMSDHWRPSRILALSASEILLAIRYWLPSHMLHDELFDNVYYMETLVSPMMLGALNLYPTERLYRRLECLLADRLRTMRDL